MSREKPLQLDTEEKRNTVDGDYKISLKQRAIEALTPVTDRTFVEYLIHLGLNREDLQDKMILDIGSGKKERFSKGAEKYGAKVYSVNPKLKNWISRKQLQGLFFRDPEWSKRSVAARTQKLPYKDNEFDIITSLYAFPLWFIEQDRTEIIKEMVRVLKPGGKIYLSPRFSDMENMLGRGTVKWLRENECSINTQQTGPSVIIMKN